MIPKLAVRAFHYIWVSGVAGIISLGLFFILTEYFSIYYIGSLVFSYLLAHTVNYFLTEKFAFNESKANRYKSYTMFMAFGVTSVTIISLITFFLTEKFALFYFASRLIATPIGGIINFTLNYFFSFDMEEFFKDDIKIKEDKSTRNHGSKKK